MFSGLLIPLLVAMFLGLNMGGSGTGPSFAMAYGSGIIRRSLIPGLFGLFVILGALLAGKNTALTLGTMILPSSGFDYVLTTIILFSVALSLLFANLFGVPQSTAQSTVVAILGPAYYLGQLNTHKIFFEIIPTWILLPLVSFGIMYLITRGVSNKFDHRHPGFFFTDRRQKFFRWVVIMMSCYAAFAIGSNNVANATGPLTSMITNELHVNPTSGNYTLILILSTLIIAPVFGIGSSIFGHKLMTRTGTDIIEIGKVEASMIQFITATLLLTASVTKGIPTSLVQMNTFAILALSISKVGWKVTFSNKAAKQFWLIWLIAPLISLLSSIFLTWIADEAGLLSV